MLSFATASCEIRHITPPELDEAHLGTKILCHRPLRHGSPNMSIEEIDDKIVAHNYGHGGSGWTLGPGTANYVNNLFINFPKANDLTIDTPITIVGAGALGLFTAYDLDQKGFSNIKIVAEQFENLTSHNAGGLLAPVSMDNDPVMQKIIDQIGIDAYKFFDAIAKKTHLHFKEGAMIVPTYFENRKDSGLEPYVGTVMQPAKDIILDFGNGTTQKMVSYDDGIFIDTAKMMATLSDYLKNKNIKFVQKKVVDFSELEEKYIINCSGMGSGILNHDKEMDSVQGHLIMLKDQNPEDSHYMILVYFGEDTTKSGQKIKRSFYYFPKRLANSSERDVGVIGGTFIEGATKDTPNKEEFGIMLKGAKKFYGLL
ncbi:MAG: FAD-dependent oxidoreductase [Janthinobacterium lividum]